MFKNRGLVVAVLVVVAAVGYFALRGGKVPPEGTQGTIGAANRYSSEQIATDQVQLDNPDVQSFLQSDVFHKIQTNPEFRAMVTDANFVAALKSGDLGLVARDPDGKRAIGGPSMGLIANSPELGAAFAKSDLRQSIAKHGDDLGLILNDKKSLALASSAEFAALAKGPGIDQLAAAGPDLGLLIRRPEYSALVQKLEAQKISTPAEVERMVKSMNLVAKAPEFARADKNGSMMNLLASPEFRSMSLNHQMDAMFSNAGWSHLMGSPDRGLIFNMPVFKLAASHPELAAIATDKELQLALQKPEVDRAISSPPIMELISKKQFLSLAANSDFLLAASNKGLGMLASRDDFAKMVTKGTTE